MDPVLLRYSVGPLLYCPGANAAAAHSIINNKFGTNYSLALCLEDTIHDDCVEEAESILIKTLDTLRTASQDQKFYMPKIFIRVRSPQQILSLYPRFKESERLVTGFIVPKFAPDNAAIYIEKMKEINALAKHTIYMMPILENPVMLNLKHRYEILYGIKDKLDSVSDLVLNVRVGGNDLCHAFGFRRQSTETIYDIRPISSIFSDIITVFGIDYTVSGPVWEYYNGANWEKGLENELHMDRLNGFVGKTVIHPKQIDLVNKAYMVTRSDYEDALSILNWKTDSALLVSGNTASNRMNEYKTHYNWARKIIQLSQTYGILESQPEVF